MCRQRWKNPHESTRVHFNAHYRSDTVRAVLSQVEDGFTVCHLEYPRHLAPRSSRSLPKRRGRPDWVALRQSSHAPDLVQRARLSSRARADPTMTRPWLKATADPTRRASVVSGRNLMGIMASLISPGSIGMHTSAHFRRWQGSSPNRCDRTREHGGKKNSDANFSAPLAVCERSIRVGSLTRVGRPY